MWVKFNFDTKKIMGKILEDIKEETPIEVKCPKCENIVWNYSYNYLKEKWELFCDNCNDSFLINLTFKTK